MSLWTPDGYLIGAVKMPGQNAGYRAGRNLGRGSGIHYTVGRDSTAIGLRGLFTWLLPKVGPPKQFAPWDAVVYHACEWNVYFPGTEFEKLSDAEATTPDQIAGMALIAAGLSEKGVGESYYDGPRIAVGAPLPASYVSHRSLHENKCDEHYDYIPAADMAQAFGSPTPSPSPSTSGDDMKGWIAAIPKGDGKQWLIDGLTRVHIASPAVKQTILEIDELRGHSLLVDHEIHNVNQAFLDACVELKD